MWRRLLTSQLKTLATAPCRSASKTVPLPFKSNVSSSPFSYLLTRLFSASSADSAVKKRVEDVMPIATGHEREELEVELQEAPAVVKSYYDKRIVGCPGGEGDDEHDVVWFWLEKGKPHECPVCSQYFVIYMNWFEVRVISAITEVRPGDLKLEVVGPGGTPDGHGDNDHHH
ncbi:hypothetical protein GOBAR_AA23316 [Gossypium barbadense]|uniref:Uncharacterized protein n=1 Tax=Gossypium barbadense TaxID=3634 RepID=A0A2P5X1Z3_GOSBA|nr:hypothetical protein GOBAR_AA23316 [Gossypium barbadense]